MNKHDVSKCHYVVCVHVQVRPCVALRGKFLGLDLYST